MDDSNNVRNVRDMWNPGERSHEELQAECSHPGRWPQALPYALLRVVVAGPPPCGTKPHTGIIAKTREAVPRPIDILSGPVRPPMVAGMLSTGC